MRYTDWNRITSNSSLILKTIREANRKLEYYRERLLKAPSLIHAKQIEAEIAHLTAVVNGGNNLLSHIAYR